LAGKQDLPAEFQLRADGGEPSEFRAGNAFEAVGGRERLLAGDAGGVGFRERNIFVIELFWRCGNRAAFRRNNLFGTTILLSGQVDKSYPAEKPPLAQHGRVKIDVQFSVWAGDNQ
jgi:hypothetical protein